MNYPGKSIKLVNVRSFSSKPFVSLLTMAAPKMAILALALAFVGLFAAGVLSAGHLLDLPVPCGRSRGCLAVAQHPSSKVFGVPIAFLGVAAYVSIIFLLGRTPRAHWARIGFVVLTGLGTVASAALLFYAQSVIRATCLWCVASGVAMCVLFILSLALLKIRKPPALPKPAWVWTLALVTCAAVGVQAGLMQKASLAPPVPVQRLAAVNVEEFIDPAKSLGRSNAAVTIVIFADLWCPACRAIHASLLKYHYAHPAGVRLVFRHLPLWEIRGHETSRAAAALSEMAGEQDQFWPFVEAVYARQRQLDRPGYLELMDQLGLKDLDAETRLSNPNDPAVIRVLRDENLAERLGIHQTPTFILLVADQQPISANQRTLPRLLNSPVVLAKLAPLASPDRAAE